MTQFTPEKRWDSWLTMFGQSKSEVHTMAHNRSIWLTIVDMLQKNKDATHNQVVNVWLSSHYSTTQAVAIRRQCDLPGVGRPRSLAQVLSEIVEYPTVFTRQRYLGGATDDLLRDREQAWQAVCEPSGKFFNTAAVKQDLDLLRSTSQKVRKYVDKNLAHSEQSTLDGKVPVTYGDINDSLNLLGEMSARYTRHLAHEYIPQLGYHPEIGWLAPFGQAWMPEGYQLMSPEALGLVPGTPPADL